jgi:hypothetical protein
VAGTAQDSIFVGDSHRNSNPFSCEHIAMLRAITARYIPQVEGLRP